MAPIPDCQFLTAASKMQRDVTHVDSNAPYSSILCVCLQDAALHRHRTLSKRSNGLRWRTLMASCTANLYNITDHFHPSNIVVIVLGGSELSQLHISCGSAAPNIHQMWTLYDCSDLSNGFGRSNQLPPTLDAIVDRFLFFVFSLPWQHLSFSHVFTCSIAA